MLNINPVTNHREREKGIIIYPVYSRRAQGLSIGVNLFPDKKNCSFNCPYCEVFPFETVTEFSLPRMEEELRKTIALAREEKTPVKDICFSGNGEPSFSPALRQALQLASKIREELAPCASLVLITNGSGLLQPHIFSMLKDAASGPIALDIWLKLDAATPEWYGKINRSSIPHDELIEKIKEFTDGTAVTIQTMLCAIDGKGPHGEEALNWQKLIVELAKPVSRGGIRKVQIYGKSRPAPEDPKASQLVAEYFEERAMYLRRALEEIGAAVSVEVYL